MILDLEAEKAVDSSKRLGLVSGYSQLCAVLGIRHRGFVAAESSKVGKMKNSFLVSNTKCIFGILVAFGITALLPSLLAQQNKTGSESPQTAWTSIQQLVKDMETAVRSKNLHGIHDPTMKIRGPIKALKQHSSMLSGDKGQKMGAALKQLDSSVTDLHSAADEGAVQSASAL